MIFKVATWKARLHSRTLDIHVRHALPDVRQQKCFCCREHIIHRSCSVLTMERNVFSANGTKCDSPGQRPGKMRYECPEPQRGEMIVPTSHAPSGLSRLTLPVSWGVAPGFHILPRCGKAHRTRHPW